VSDSTDIPDGYNATELGVLPEEWNTCSLNQNELFEFENGIWKGAKGELIDCNILRNTNFRNDGTLNYSDVAALPIEKRHIIKKQLKIGDIVIERSGGGPTQPVGRVVFFERDYEIYCFSNFTSRLRVVDQKKVDPKYLHLYLFYFHSIGKTNELQQRTTGIRNLMFEDYKKTVIPLPPLVEQHAIATTLRTVQEAKEKTDDVIAATKALKAAMMKHLFTYGPVPTEDAEKVALRETEIGQIPDMWETGQLNDYCSLIIDCPHSTPHFIETGVLVIRTSHVRDGKLVFNPPSYLSEEEYKERIDRGEPQENDLLFTREAPIGEACLVPTNTRLCLGQRMMLIRPDKSKMNPYFLMRSLYSEKIQNEMHTRGSGVTAKHLNVTDVKRLKIPIPPLPVQNKITRILSSIDQKLAAEQSRKEALDTMFTSLLHDLMTAKIRVGCQERPATKTSP
jgi:type I restriction enzyme S subunit